MRLLSLILLLCAACGSAGASGQPLDGSLSNKTPPVAADTPDPRQPTLGEYGEPVWYWPGLPADSVFFTQTFRVPSACSFRGLRLVTFGGQAQDAPRGLWALRVRVDSGVVFQEEGVLFSGAGVEEDYLPQFDGGNLQLPLLTGQVLSVELYRSHGSYPPYLSGDGDCLFQGGQSAMGRIGSASLPQPLGRDLCLKALVDFPADTRGPALYLGRPPDWPLANGSLPVRVRAFDPGGVASVTVYAWQDGGDTLGVPAVHGGVAGGDWLASLPLGGFTAGPLNVLHEATDSLFNTSDSLLVVTLDAGDYLWAGEASRVDRMLTPGYPMLSGMATAVRLGITDFSTETPLQGFQPVGGRSRLSGPGDCLMHLVPDDDGLPMILDDEWVDASPPVLLAGSEECYTWRGFAFATVVDSLKDTAAWWIIQEYFTGDELFVSAGEQLDTLATGSTSWMYDPQIQEWQALDGLHLMHQVRVSVESCEQALPYTADFDSTSVTLDCWTTDAVAPGSAGWLLGSRDGGINPRSEFFVPLGSRENDEGHGIVADTDSLHVPSTIAFINSDAVRTQLLQDSLITPFILSGTSSAPSLSFFSFYGDFQGEVDEEATLIFRSRSAAGQVGPWQLLLGAEELVERGSLDNGDLVPVWARRSATLPAMAAGSALQVGFVYRGLNAYGWAIDDLRIETVAAPVIPPGPGLVSIERTWPNPFNPSTTIEFVLRQRGPVRGTVHNLLGQQVARLLDENSLGAGVHRVEFRPDGLASGLYFVRIESRGQVDQRRIILVK